MSKTEILFSALFLLPWSAACGPTTVTGTDGSSINTSDARVNPGSDASAALDARTQMPPSEAGVDARARSDSSINTDAPPFHPPSCATAPQPGRPSDAPHLSTATWTAINPAGFPFNENTTTSSLAVNPCDPSIIYVSIGSFDSSLGGMFRSTNAGSSWARIAHVVPNYTGVDHLDEPITILIDPRDPNHIYAADGVRGSTQGFWVSHDGGDNFAIPQGFVNLGTPEMFPWDLYHISVDPSDFNHVLVSNHSAWSWDAPYHMNSGVFESRDGGDTWIVHPPMDGWGSGHVINFLYDPALGIGDSNTWLLGTQSQGNWRTSDAGTTWTRVSNTGIQHGGGTVAYSRTGVLYATGTPSNLRSTDNGLTWSSLGGTSGYNCLFDDGSRLWTAPGFGPTPFLTSLDTDGLTWTASSSQQFSAGPFEMTLDQTNRILYASMWGLGVMALKLQ